MCALNNGDAWEYYKARGVHKHSQTHMHKDLDTVNGGYDNGDGRDYDGNSYSEYTYNDMALHLQHTYNVGMHNVHRG